MKIIIPTCKSENDLGALIKELRGTTPKEVQIVIATSGECAAYNRNMGLSEAKFDELVVMMDDDITGFFPGWHEMLLGPFLVGWADNVVMVSARLMRPDGKLGIMVGDNYETGPQFIVVEKRRLPTACIAFRNEGMTFDESFKGSGFEDDDFCKQLGKRYPDGKFLINNRVKLVHKNEMKHQGGKNWEHNRRYFLRKWPDEENRWNIGDL